MWQIEGNNGQGFTIHCGLKKLATNRLAMRKHFLTFGSNEGAVYLSGYSVELALKAKFARHLGWEKFDESILKIHSLKLLLRFTGLESKKDSFAIQIGTAFCMESRNAL